MYFRLRGGVRDRAVMQKADEKNMIKGSRREEPSNGRQAARLDAGLDKSLSAYASAAIAAGVSALAMTKPAEAKIIYTPAHTNIPVGNRPVLLDLNHDGIADFSFWNLQYPGSGSGASDLIAGCAAIAVSRSSSTCRYQTNQIWGKGGFASALRHGFKVRPNKSYFQLGQKRRGAVLGPAAWMAFFFARGSTNGGFSSTAGQWLYTKDRYLGLQFTIGGRVHYGWARVAVTLPGGASGIQATLTGYAFETIPNKPIVTGKTKGPDVVTWKPATLGRLAQGASGISAWRGKK
jgi:hypothetical protein